ncbi:GNAT family N-acetyltransferase [Fusibacter sp. JL216-2]|uniref:GNAT family N-acetyltransferase n=1 Tax=Fusibacter sp. JL216-2 TaxID=3071453 RepID=UPI003D353E5E
MKEFRLRHADLKDIDKIMRIEKASFDPESREDKSVFIERLDTYSDGFFVMESEGEIIGFICTELWVYKDEVVEGDFELGHSILDMHSDQGTELYISAIGISPKHRGKGAGKMLFQEGTGRILKDNPNIKSQILIVSEAWKNARKIYKKTGFREVLRITDFFENKAGEKENGIVMRKREE